MDDKKIKRQRMKTKNIHDVQNPEREKTTKEIQKRAKGRSSNTFPFSGFPSLPTHGIP